MLHNFVYPIKIYFSVNCNGGGGGGGEEEGSERGVCVRPIKIYFSD